MIWRGVEELKRQVDLLDYLESHGWEAKKSYRAGRKMLGLCPLHRESNPSFVADLDKQLFYCHGCGRGGDVIRLAELWQGLRFSEAVVHLRTYGGRAAMLADTVTLYRMQMAYHPEAAYYLSSRGLHDPMIIDRLRIGYAPGRCLRRWMASLGYSQKDLQSHGLLNAAGCDRFCHRIVFPLEGNLYGRSIGSAAPHMFLPQPKGGLYDWQNLRWEHELILVEGLFDLAVLWQAGFPNTTCSLGTRLNPTQMNQLCDGYPRTVYVAFDSDAAGGGHRAAWELSVSMLARGVRAVRVMLPEGHDPNSLFCAGATAQQFHRLLEVAHP